MLTHIGLSLVVIGILFSILATFAVALRFRARHVKGVQFGLDDWVIALGLLFIYVNNYAAVWGVYNTGFGDPENTLTPAQKIGYRKVLFVFTLFWQLATGTIKCSILLLYRRIFTTRKFGIAVNILLAIVLSWLVANAFVIIFSWTPVQGFWTRRGHPNINYAIFLIVTGVLTLVLDFVTLSYPLFVIHKLHMTRGRKVAVAGIFMLGALCVVASIVRIPYSVWYLQGIGALPGRGSSMTISSLTPTISLWAMIEVDVGVIAACLPTYPSLLRDRSVDSIIRSARAMVSISSQSSTKSKSSSDSGSAGSSNKRSARDLTPNNSYYAAAARDDSPDNHTLTEGSRVILKGQKFDVTRTEQV